MSSRFISTCLLLSSILAGSACAAPVGPLYRVITFTSPLDSFPTVADLNNAGQLVGQYTIQGSPASATGYISVGRELRPLPAIPGYRTWAKGANDHGGVVGIAANDDFSKPNRAFFYQNGQMRDLGTLGGAWAQATAVNNSDQVIGVSANIAGEERAFLYTGGKMTDLSALAPAGRTVTPFDINQRGDITGSWVVDGEARGFLYRNGTWSDLGDIGGMNAWGRRLNDSGSVTGDAIRIDNRDVPFIYTPEAGMREIHFPNDAFQLVGRGINAHGDVVGDGYSDHGPCCNFLYSEGKVSLLNDLLAPGSGWHIYQAIDINDAGQIAAFGCGDPGCMIVRLDPVPEPATYAMLLGGLAALLWAGRRRKTGRVARAGGLLALLAGAMAGAAAAAPAAYTITPYPPGGADAYATEMNQHGHMLGMLLRSGGPWTDDGVRSAFLTTGPGFVDIGLVMPSFSPAGVNDLDQVAGTATVGMQGRQRAYLFQNGGVSNLGTLGGNNSGASAINNGGQVVGFSSLADGSEHAMLYQNGVMHDLGTLGTSSHARDINDSGQVAGEYADAAGHTRAFIYDNGSMRDLGTLGGDFAMATDIGNGGHILGVSTSAGGSEHNFIYHDGVMVALAEGARPIRALGINGMGDAVGSMLGAPEHGAYLWSGGRLYDIAAMVSPEWQVRDAVAINDLGQIAATGCLRGSCSAVLLSPIPEPALPTMLLTGIVTLGLLRRRGATTRR